jgi:plasmid stability protein
MCQMCDEYEAELRRMGIAMDEKITVEFDTDEMAALRLEAEAHGHDVAAEVRERVRRTLPPVQHGEIDFVAWSRRIRAMTPKGVPQTDSLTLLREDRNR